MPELPEVETIRVGLERMLKTRTISSIDFNWEKSFPNNTQDVKNHAIGAKVTHVKRLGKVIIIELSTGYSFIIHLKMTGQLIFAPALNSIIHNLPSTSNDPADRFAGGHPNDSLINDLPDKSTRVIIVFTDGSKLFFNDQRKFGWVRLIANTEIFSIDFFKKLGPDALGSDLNGEILFKRMQRRKNSPVKAVILDQTILAGVGNIYTDESLWGAKINPATPVKLLSQKQIDKLYKEIVFVMKLSIEKGGSTDKNYVDAEGKKGSYLKFAKVFRREGQECPRCGSIIEKTRVVGRGTHFCPSCQKPKEIK